MWNSGLITADAIYCQEGDQAWLQVASLLDPKAAATAPQQPEQVQAESEKRILPAIILCLFLGVFGAHAFYAGWNKQGIAMIGCLLAPVLVFIFMARLMPEDIYSAVLFGSRGPVRL